MTLIRAKTKNFISSKTMLASMLFFTLITNVAHLQTQNLFVIAYGQAESLPPVGAGDIIGGIESDGQEDNNISNSDTDITRNNGTGIESNECVMPPCPPGHACIQSCP